MSRQGESAVEKAQDAHRALNLLPFPELPDREIVRRVLHLANDCTDEQKQEALFVSVLSHGLPTNATAAMARSPGSDYLRKQWAALADDRDRFREQIELVYESRDVARRKLRNEVAAALKDIVPIPRLVLTAWNVQTEIRYYALTWQAACGFTLALLLDESRGLGAALKKCKLSPCPNIFLSLPSAGGGRPPLYCSRDHQSEFAAQSGADRTERWRKKKAKKRTQRSKR
jgi:hypothetical protein